MDLVEQNKKEKKRVKRCRKRKDDTRIEEDKLWDAAILDMMEETMKPQKMRKQKGQQIP